MLLMPPMPPIPPILEKNIRAILRKPADSPRRTEKPLRLDASDDHQRRSVFQHARPENAVSRERQRT